MTVFSVTGRYCYWPAGEGDLSIFLILEPFSALLLIASDTVPRAQPLANYAGTGTVGAGVGRHTVLMPGILVGVPRIPELISY